MTVVLALLAVFCLAFVAGACWEHLRVEGSRDLAVRLDRVRNALRIKQEQALEHATRAAADVCTWKGPQTWQ